MCLCWLCGGRALCGFKCLIVARCSIVYCVLLCMVVCLFNYYCVFQRLCIGGVAGVFVCVLYRDCSAVEIWLLRIIVHALCVYYVITVFA